MPIKDICRPGHNIPPSLRGYSCVPAPRQEESRPLGRRYCYADAERSFAPAPARTICPACCAQTVRPDRHLSPHLLGGSPGASSRRSWLTIHATLHSLALLIPPCLL